MMFALELVSGPDIEPVTVAEMKQHLREYASMTEMDATISSLITAAREWAEQFTGRVLIDQTWRLTVERTGSLAPEVVASATVTGQWNMARAGEIPLRRAPVLSIESIVSIDAAGTETAIDSESYSLRLAASKYPKVVALNGGKWGQEYLQVTFRAGYADRAASPVQDAAVVPERYKQAIKLWVQANYNPNVDEVAGLLKTAENLIKGERVELSLA
jgi:hypothetical protein